jgi:CRISPR system Cascade subunit CasD
MTAHLLFRLYGPLASWGDIAVGEFRPTHAAPSKSAVLGLVAGSLGLRRDDAAALAVLHEAYGFAVRVDDPGFLVRDYHTIETPFASVGERMAKTGPGLATRRDELLAAGKADASKTNLSRREYRMDAVAAAAVWIREPARARWTLDQLAQALRTPRFTPYLGRKSCSPALPLQPCVVEAPHPVQALRDTKFALDPMMGIRAAAHVEYRWEGPDAPDARPQQVVRRRDQARSRTAWLFAEREENLLVERRPAPQEGGADAPEQD